MDSLNQLSTSLPAANLRNAENDLLNNFKAAALSITTLYRSSRTTSKRAYNAGYGAACQDLLMMIQQGVSLAEPGGSHHDADGTSGMTIGKVMDWVEARLEAIKSREEEEDEDEEKERERERERAKTKAAPIVPTKPAVTQVNSIPTPHSLRSTTAHPPSSQPPSPSPPPPRPRPTTTITRLHKSRSPPQKDPLPLPSSSTPTPTFTFTPHPLPHRTPTPSLANPIPPTEIAAGAKRRHAVMMMLDSSPSTPPTPLLINNPNMGPTPPTSVLHPNFSTNLPHSTHHHPRRRTRSARSSVAPGGGGGGGAPAPYQRDLNVNLTLTSDSMDVEEDGRERKRVARR